MKFNINKERYKFKNSGLLYAITKSKDKFIINAWKNNLHIFIR